MNVNAIALSQTLTPLFEYVQIVKCAENKVIPNRKRVLQGAGSITDEEAEVVRKMIHDEFTHR